MSTLTMHSTKMFITTLDSGFGSSDAYRLKKQMKEMSSTEREQRAERERNLKGKNEQKRWQEKITVALRARA